jgi:hypothetical protein
VKEITHKQAIHRQYLQSPLWRSVRKNALIQFGEICAKCGGYGTDVHHLTYERVGGDELIEDLQVLCRDCHEAVHAMERATRNQKSISKGCSIEVLHSSLTPSQKRKIEEMFQCNAYALLTSPSLDGINARKMARSFLGVHFTTGNFSSELSSERKKINAINQFFYREEYKKLKNQGFLTPKKASELRKKYFSVDKVKKI